MAAEEKDYQFASGAVIDSFIAEMQQEKQHTVEDPFAGLEDLDEEPTDVEDEAPSEKIDTRMTKTAANASGAIVVGVIDTILPAILGFIAKEDAKEYKADPDQRADLEVAMSNYMALQGEQIPPGYMVLILIVGIYATQIPAALQHRKLNEREAALNEREKALNAKAEEMKKLAEQSAKPTEKPAE